MGGCVSVSMSCDQVVNQGSQWLCLKGSYVHNLYENLASLEKAMGVLKAKRDDLQRRVNREELTGNQCRLAQVQVWLTSVLTIENQFNDLLKTSTVEVQKLCFCGFCSKNLKQSYKYGKRVIMMLKDVENLGSQGEFDVVTEAAPIAQVEEMPIQATIVGQETLLEKVWNRLMEDEVGIVGLYGMGGVGKTTLLTQINNRFSEIGGNFDIVLWVVVSNGASIYKIQSDIGEKLGLKGEEWNKKNENQRALDIYKALRKQKFVLLLDDIWDKVTLKTVGVPFPNKENGSKVAFTTRSLEVCGRMGVDQPIKVSCLDSGKAWELFEKKVGVNTLTSHPNIPQLARKVAEKCCGLPLALNVIGETMACKNTIQEWYHAIDVLTSCAADFPDVENEVLPILKYSYDNLREEKVKSCFLYCSLFPEDYHIGKERLINYWICEGLIVENKGRENALHKGYEILGTLLRACLLLDRDTRFVSMHDVVREMALWITTDFGKNKDQWIVQAGVGLPEIPKVKNWKDVKKMSLMENDIEEIIVSPECSQLTTLFLQLNSRLVNISGEFFLSMARLLVLDLSFNGNITELPEEISNLVSLRYLNLSFTMITQLPIGLLELKMLIHLNLDCTTKLESFHGISKLSSLRILQLRSSNMMLDMSLMKELELLEHLEYITISISPSLVEEQLSYDSRVWRCIQVFHIKDLGEESVRILVLPAAMSNLHVISIERCGILEIKIEKISWNKSLSTPSFSNLSYVRIDGCDGLKDLTWLLFAPNITHLYVGNSRQIESVINEEKAASVLEEEDQCNIIPLQKLKCLDVDSLPELKSIYWNSLPFPCLQRIYVSKCPNLRKLPLNSQSVAKIEEFTIEFDDDEGWKNKIEWEDEDTKLRFLPSFRRE